MEAKEKKYKQVLILEDDIFFKSSNARTYADECMLNIPADFDVLLGGVYHAVDLTHVNEFWNKASDSCALHFSIFNETVYDKILEFDYSTHIDRWIAQNRDIKSYIANEFFALQYDGFSDNTQVATEYNKTLLNKFKVLK